jgi:hypothetical protein
MLVLGYIESSMGFWERGLSAGLRLTLAWLIWPWNMPKVFAKCIKDGKEITGLFELVFDENLQPYVVVDAAKKPGKTLARTLSINPQWLRRVQKSGYEYEYGGVINIWPSNRN